MHVVAVDLVEVRIMNVIRAAIDSPCPIRSPIGISGRLGASVNWDGRRPERQSDQKRFGKHALIVNHKRREFTAATTPTVTRSPVLLPWVFPARAPKSSDLQLQIPARSAAANHAAQARTAPNE